MRKRKIGSCIAAAALMAGCATPAQRFVDAIERAHAANRPIVIYDVFYKRGFDAPQVSFINSGRKSIAKAWFRVLGFEATGQPGRGRDTTTVLVHNAEVRPGDAGTAEAISMMSSRVLCVILTRAELQFEDGSKLALTKEDIEDYLTRNVPRRCSPFVGRPTAIH